MAKEIDIIHSPIEEILETPEGINAAKNFAADTLRKVYLSKNVPEADAKRVAEGIMHQTDPKLTERSLSVARILFPSLNPQQ